MAPKDEAGVSDEHEKKKPLTDGVGRQREAPKTDIESLKRELEMDAHMIPLEELLDRLHSSVMQGLTTAVAKKRLQEDGPNALKPPPTTSEWVKFAKQLFGGLQILLWIGSFLCFLAYVLQSAAYDEPPKDNVRSLFFLASLLPFIHSFIHSTVYVVSIFIKLYCIVECLLLRQCPIYSYARRSTWASCLRSS